MAIITISRGTFGGGQKLAELLAKRLGYRLVSREDLYHHLEENYGFTPEQAAEIMEQAPDRREHVVTKQNRVLLGQKRRQLFYALQASLCEFLRGDNVVYHGQAGNLLLPGFSHLLRLRLIAPHPMRVKMAMERESMSKIDAVKKIDRVDSERARWTQAFFGVSWEDPSLFDMVINLEYMTLDEAADVVAHTVALPSYKTTAESRKALGDVCLASFVAAEISSNPETAHLEVDTEARDGVVRILGLHNAAELEKVRSVAGKVEGAKKFEAAELSK
jgi:cytidylate kinase